MKATIFLCVSLAVCASAAQLDNVTFKSKSNRASTLPATKTAPTSSKSAATSNTSLSTTPPPSTDPTPSTPSALTSRIQPSITSIPNSPTTPASAPNGETQTSETQPQTTSTDVVTQPPCTVEELKNQIVESAKRGSSAFTLAFQRYAYNASTPGKNILFSPVNIVGMLATLLLGAGGKTKEEMLQAVGLSSDQTLVGKEHRIHTALGKLLKNFSADAMNNPATTVEVAQGIFLQNDIKVKEFFKNYSRIVYKNEIFNVDFSSPSSNAGDIINNWVDNRTNHRINKIVDGPMPTDTKMIIASTLFFNGEWQSPFLNESTWKPFYAQNGSYSVKMMANIAPVYAYMNADKKYTAIGLPYKGDNIVMYFVLPDRDQSLENVLKNFSTEDLTNIATNSEALEEFSYEIPYMNTNDETNLKDILESMGMKRIFDPALANLSNIDDGVFVSRIVHKANLDVTEAGSTGSASTVVHIETKFPTEPFVANRPFLHYVYHRSSSLISFWGVINLPVPNKPLPVPHSEER